VVLCPQAFFTSVKALTYKDILTSSVGHGNYLKTALCNECNNPEKSIDYSFKRFIVFLQSKDLSRLSKILAYS